MEAQNTIIGRTYCGPACLWKVMEHHGIFKTFDEVKTDCGTGAAGTHAGQIISAASANGLSGTAYARTVGLLAETALPAILHWNGNHFVVLEAVDFEKKSAVIYDPQLDRKRVLHTEQLAYHYSGVCIEFSS